MAMVHIHHQPSFINHVLCIALCCNLKPMFLLCVCWVVKAICTSLTTTGYTLSTESGTLARRGISSISSKTIIEANYH